MMESTQSPSRPDAGNTFGGRFRTAIQSGILPAIGIYDAFSASLAAREFPALFVSGFSFAASHYGLPDLGYIAWSDIVDLVQRLRALLPQVHLLVDMDDGYGDPAVAAHVARVLEKAGASGIVLEDQQRPRRCGHFEGKRVMPMEEYLEKLQQVLDHRRDMVVVARTDASEPDEILRRVRAFSEAGADAVLADGLKDLNWLDAIRQSVTCPVVFNQMAGGKSPPCTLTELSRRGVSLVIYSAPCLFAAQSAITKALKGIKEEDGKWQVGSAPTLQACSAVLMENLQCSRLP